MNLDQFPNVKAWWQRIADRPAVQKAINIPSEPRAANAVYQKRLKEDPEFKENEDKLKELADKAKKQYDYKYASP